MVNFKEFRQSYDQKEYQDSDQVQASGGFALGHYRPPLMDQQQNNSKFNGSSSDEFYRPGLGFLPEQTSYSETNNDNNKTSKYLKPIKFTRAKKQRYLHMDTVTNTNTTSSEAVKPATTPDKPEERRINIDKKPPTKKNEKSLTAVNKTPPAKNGPKNSPKNVDKKPVKNTSSQNAATKSKDLQESSHDQSVEDRIVVQDFEHGTSVDEDELERLLGYTKIEDKTSDKSATLEKPSLISDSLKTENNDDDNAVDVDVSDSEQEGQLVYQREIEKRHKKEIRDKQKAEKKQHDNYMKEWSGYQQYPNVQYQQQDQYSPASYQPYSQYSQYPHYPQTQYSQYPQYPQYPQSQYAQSQYPQSQYPQPQYYQSQYSQAWYPEQYYPSQYYNPSYAHTIGYMETGSPNPYINKKETGKERKKRLLEHLKAEKKAQKTGIADQGSYVDPKDRQELEILEKRVEKKAERKAQKKHVQDLKKMEESEDPEFVKLMMDIDEKMQAFINDESATSYEFEPIPVDARRHLHVIAALYGLRSKSYGSPTERRNVITKTEHTNLPENRQRIERHIFTTPDAKSLNKLIGKLNAKNKPQKEVAAGVLPLDEDNVGHRMLSAMGWKEGDSLGVGEGGITAPITAVIRQNKKGLGY